MLNYLFCIILCGSNKWISDSDSDSDELTGFDTISSIYGVGKVMAVKALQKGHLPSQLGNDEIENETIVSGAKTFSLKSTSSDKPKRKWVRVSWHVLHKIKAAGEILRIWQHWEINKMTGYSIMLVKQSSQQ